MVLILGCLNSKEDYIKRVIGLPGETIEVKNSTVYVNGEALNEPYLYEAINYELVRWWYRRCSVRHGG